MAEYYMFNKPRGCISACRDARCKTVLDYFPVEASARLFHVGRLDKDTEGLLILTDDGALCNRLMNPERKVKKTYFFWARGVLSEEAVVEIESGISINKDSNFVTAPAKIEFLDNARLKDIKHLLSYDELKRVNRRGEEPVFSGIITVTEGKKHQVKKMIGYGGCKVVYLKRLSIGGLRLDEALECGNFRALTDEELILLEKNV